MNCVPIELISNTFAHADFRHPVDIFDPVAIPISPHSLAAEVIAKAFIWVAEGRTLDDRGFRATVALACVRPDLFNGATLEKLGQDAGRQKQRVWDLVNDFCAVTGFPRP